MVDYKMAEEKNNTKEKKDKASPGKGTRDWKEDEVSMLIKLWEKKIQNVVLKIHHINKKLTFLDVILL